VVSTAGAAGFWQFMDSAAKKYGLIINDDVDERNNVEKATIAACKYLKESHSRYNNWTMAAASYNRGDLENALIEPEKYKHIFVRVGGFTARFVELSRDVQQDILSRTLY
jgi:pyruvate-formate lyase